MRLIIALLAGVLLSQPLLAAPKKKPAPVKKVKSAFQAKFLTFNQLTALPKAKREQYVKDVIKLIVTMERANSHYEVADGSMSLDELKYKFAMMEQWLNFLPDAEARSYQRTRQQASGVMTWDGSAFVCGAGYEVDLSIPGCLKVNSDGSTMFNEYAREHGSCDGMQEIGHPDPFAPPGARACMSVQGFNKLAPERRAALREGKDVFLDPNGFMRQPHEQQMEIAYGGSTSPSEGNSAVAGTPEVSAPTTPPATAPSVPDAAGSGTTTPPPVAAAPAEKPAPVEKPATVEKPSTVEKPAPAEKPAATEKPEAVAEDPKADKCIPEARSCDDVDEKKRDEAISRFRKTAKFEGLDANICIAGGFPSKYDSAKKTAGSCKPVYKWGPGTCKESEVLCNPVLFCHTAKNEQGKARPQWFCVSKKKTAGQSNPQWTAACAAELQNRLKTKQKYSFTYSEKDASGKVKKVTKMSEPQEAETCNPSDMKVGGFQEEWNNLIAGLEKIVDVWCGKNDGFKALFCRECQIISAQMYAMTKKATGEGCAPAAAGDGKTPEETEGNTGSAPAEKSETAK